MGKEINAILGAQTILIVTYGNKGSFCGPSPNQLERAPMKINSFLKPRNYHLIESWSDCSKKGNMTILFGSDSHGLFSTI